jgi:hypothetical protein
MGNGECRARAEQRLRDFLIGNVGFFRVATIQELSHCGSDRDAESRHLPLRARRHSHMACVSGVLTLEIKS